MKKKQIFLKTIVAITLLSAMLVSALLGTSNAEYFKSFNKTLSLEMKPDLNLSYHLRHYPDPEKPKDRNIENGTYKDSKKFTQEICVGQTAAISNSSKTVDPYVYKNAEWWQNNNTKYTGDNIIYQIRIPVDETGYYTLDFAVDFWKDGEDQTKEFYTITYDRAVGCEIVNDNDDTNDDTKYEFGQVSYLDLYTRSNNDAVYVASTNKSNPTNSNKEMKRLDTDGTYQWKTLCPSRQEYVSLSFKVDADDVKKGYVIWAWDFAGLYGPQKYILECTDISVEKVMNLDGTTDTRDSDDPYFMFPQTDLVNNQLVLSILNPDNKNDYYFFDEEETVRGVQAKGKTSYSQGRGTFATEATTNSLQIQAESIYYGCKASNSTALTASNGDTYSNPLAFYVPVKNVKPGVTYKVTFDLSIARQGDYTVDGLSATHGGENMMHAAYMTNRYHADYATYSNMFKSGTNVFSSYLYAGVSGENGSAALTNRSLNHHQDHGMTAISYNNKVYNGKYPYLNLNGEKVDFYAPLTKYDEVTSLGSINNSISTNVNDTYSITKIEGDKKSATRNWYNAVQNIEYNGQNKINWLTFYNTTFSFNIDSASSNGLTIDPNTGYITNLEWAWVIDSVIPMSYYRIRLDNVRIQEVVEYGSFLDRNGVLIGDEKLTTDYADHFDKDTDNYNPKTEGWLNGLFVSYRGINGTGQNFQAKGSVLNEYAALKDAQVFMSEGNIYAPIVDAAKIPIANGKDSDYKIAISGYAVCQGGIDRYVFSVDGGITWHDMTLNGIDTDARSAGSYLSKAGNAVNQYASGQTGYHKKDTHEGKNEFTWSESDLRPTYDECTHIAFTSNDAQNGNFKAMDNGMDSDPDPDMGWCLTADLSDFKHQANLDIIIAAVPETNQDLRCEILRIINYNQIQKYYTHAQNIVSDITVTGKTYGESLLNAFYFHTETINDECENLQDFTNLKGYRADGNVQAQIGSYSNRLLRSNAYEDVPALFSDIPIYKELSITGVAVAEKGIEGFYWTVDDGKTWYPCDTVSGKVYGETKTDTGSASTMKTRYEQWTGDTYANTKGIAFNKWENKQFKSYIRANLSAYEGQVVDVLFAAKPNQSDVYVPVAKVDNVAVYGEQGTIYTRVHKVIIDGRTNEAPSGNKDVTVPTQTYANSSGTKLNYQDKWNIGYSDQAYVIFEPQNVNAANAKYLFNDVKEIESAGRVTIDGYVMCKGGVSRYKFSLDGGETWTVINDFGTNIPADANANGTVTPKYEMFKNCKKSDAGFNLATDGKNGNFCCTGMDKEGADTYYPNSGTAANRKAFYNHALEFNIPALPQGAERDLLVVAENDPDGDRATDDGKEFPVLHMKIRVKNTQYGYQNIANKANFSTIQAGYTTNNRSWEFDPAFSDVVGENNKTLNRITIPVTETGEHTITFDHTISNPAVTREGTKRQLYDEQGNAQSEKYTDFTLSVPKTHFAYKEAINVDFSCGFNSATDDKTEYGTIKLVIISNDWKNQNGEQHAIRAQSYEPEFDSNGKYSVSVDIRKLSYENAGLTASSKDFKAGSYSILLLHTAPGELSNILITQKSRDAFILAEIPIYIHEEGVEFSVVHDEGKYTYFSDVSRQLTAGDDNVDTIRTLTAAELFDTPGTVAKTITGTVNVTEGDVRRGYIVLDTNYTGLWAGNKHTRTQCETEYGDDNFGKNNLHASEHADNLCISRDTNNGSTFTRILPGQKLRDVWSNGSVVSTMKHPGITYTVNISLSANAFVKKT